jgi:hypothetical protein
MFSYCRPRFYALIGCHAISSLVRRNCRDLGSSVVMFIRRISANLLFQCSFDKLYSILLHLSVPCALALSDLKLRSRQAPHSHHLFVLLNYLIQSVYIISILRILYKAFKFLVRRLKMPNGIPESSYLWLNTCRVSNGSLSV